MYIAKVSFSGKVVGVKGKKLDINDKNIAFDLLNAGYIEPIELKEVKKQEKKQTSKKKK